MKLRSRLLLALTFAYTLPLSTVDAAERRGAPRPLQPGEARISVGQQDVVHRRGRQGEFPTLLAAPKARVPITLKLAGPLSDAPVRAGVMDGGRLFVAKADGSSAPLANGRGLAPDSAGQVHLIFEADAGEGVYRVFVHRGADRYFFEFWVGDKLPTDRRK